MVSLTQEGSADWMGTDGPSDFACEETADRETAEGPRSDSGGRPVDAVTEGLAGSDLLAGEGTEDLGFEGADAG